MSEAGTVCVTYVLAGFDDRLASMALRYETSKRPASVSGYTASLALPCRTVQLQLYLADERTAGLQAVVKAKAKQLKQAFLSWSAYMMPPMWAFMQNVHTALRLYVGRKDALAFLLIVLFKARFLLRRVKCRRSSQVKSFCSICLCL